MSTPINTTDAASPFATKAFFFSEAKKPGPTCKPIEYTNKISPNSLRKCSASLFTLIPQYEAASPIKSTQVTPSEMPLKEMRPNQMPIAITKPYTATVCGIPGTKNKSINHCMRLDLLRHKANHIQFH